MHDGSFFVASFAVGSGTAHLAAAGAAMRADLAGTCADGSVAKTTADRKTCRD